MRVSVFRAENKKKQKYGLSRQIDLRFEVFGMRRYGVHGVPSGNVAVKRLRRASNDDDDVLLPYNGKVAAARAFLAAPELKFFDCYLLATDCGEAANLSDGIRSIYCGPIANGPLFNPGLGDGLNARNDRRVLVRSWHVKGSLQVLPIDNGTKIPEGISVFIALVQDKQTNGAQCSAADVYINASGSQNLLMCLQRNPLRGSRFDVIRSEIVDMKPIDFEVLDILTPDQTASVGQWAHFEFFMPLDCEVNFMGNAGTIADIVDNSWHVIAFRTPHNAVLAEKYAPVRIVFTSRFRYIENL